MESFADTPLPIGKITIMITGNKLNRQWAVMAKHALYRKTGDWYHRLKHFPGALFDEHGYIYFKTSEQFLNCPHLQIKSDVHVPNGIATIPGYVRVLKTAMESGEHEHIEGKVYLSKLSRFERNPRIRKKCIDYHGAICKACGINFEKVYGIFARGVIIAHHLIMLSSRRGAHKVNPITDLLPVCPNCHAVIHKRTPPFTIDEIKDLLNQNRG